MTIPAAATLHHTAFLVRNLEATAQRLSDTLGIGPWNVWTIVPAECMVRGQPAQFTFRAAMAAVGAGTFELITPHTGQSIYDDYLAQRGDGYHHICLVYPTLDAVREAKAELRRQGREIIQEGSAGDVFDFGYVAFPEIGSLVELLFLDVTKLPPPDAVIGPISAAVV